LRFNCHSLSFTLHVQVNFLFAKMDVKQRQQLQFDATALFSVTDQRTADQVGLCETSMMKCTTTTYACNCEALDHAIAQPAPDDHTRRSMACLHAVLCEFWVTKRASRFSYCSSTCMNACTHKAHTHTLVDVLHIIVLFT
jgi:hypothetical protein